MKINFFASIGGRWVSAANDPLCLKNVARPQWLRVSLCALWLFVPSLLGAQGFGFDDCMLPPGTALFGSGAPNGTIADDGTGTNCVVHLTEAGQNSSWGAFLIPDQAAGNNVDHITVRWRSLIGGGGGGGADGYSFNWATDLPSPPSNGNPGEEGAGTGLSVTVDTFDNGCADCATGTDTGLEIKWRGARVAYLHTDKSFLRKGQFADAEANVDTSGAATFTYDGITISAQLAGWTGIAGGSYMFGARTGGANDNQWIDDVVITAFGPGSDFKLDWFAVAAGGGHSSGGDFELFSTIGQPIVGETSGGDFAMIGGFISIVNALQFAEPPVIQCPTNPIVVTLPCSSNCVPVSYPLPTVLNGALVSCTPPSGTCLPAGIHPILCRGTNQSTEAECTFNVQVVPEPVQPPTIQCPTNFIVALPCNSNCVAVSYPPPTVLNGALVSCTPPSGTCLPAGVHPILCRATNRCSEAECVFTVQVVPEPIQPPVIQCPTNFIVTLPCNSNCVAVSYPPPTVLNGALVSCTPPSGTCLPAGVHPVLCRAANLCSEAECVFTVQVVAEPVQPPVLRVTLAGPGSVLISWPAPSTCWVLEQSSTLGPSARWTEVRAAIIQNGSNNTVTQSPVTGSRFYRLNHP